MKIGAWDHEIPRIVGPRAEKDLDALFLKSIVLNPM